MIFWKKTINNVYASSDQKSVFYTNQYSKQKKWVRVLSLWARGPACRLLRIPRWDERKREAERAEMKTEVKRTRCSECMMYRREKEKRTKRIPHDIICSLSVPSSVLHFDSSLFPRLIWRFINVFKKKIMSERFSWKQFCIAI